MLLRFIKINKTTSGSVNNFIDTLGISNMLTLDTVGISSMLTLETAARRYSEKNVLNIWQNSHEKTCPEASLIL